MIPEYYIGDKVRLGGSVNSLLSEEMYREHELYRTKTGTITDKLYISMLHQHAYIIDNSRHCWTARYIEPLSALNEVRTYDLV